MTGKSTDKNVRKGGLGDDCPAQAGQWDQSRNYAAKKWETGLRTTRRSAASSEVVRVGKSKGLKQNSH
jgi:hypothetical protein